jgi:hypothetical protein
VRFQKTFPAAFISSVAQSRPQRKFVTALEQSFDARERSLFSMTGESLKYFGVVPIRVIIPSSPRRRFNSFFLPEKPFDLNETILRKLLEALCHWKQRLSSLVIFCSTRRKRFSGGTENLFR